MSIDKIKCCISGFLKPIIPTIYDGSYKTLDELVAACIGTVCESTETINQIIEELANTNQRIDDLQSLISPIISEILNGWLQDGTLGGIISESLFKSAAGKTNSNGAVTKLLQVGLSYYNRDIWTYGNWNGAFNTNCTKTGTRWEIDCSTFTQLCLMGVPFENSRYNFNSTNIPMTGFYTFDDFSQYQDPEAQRPYGLLAGELAHYAYDRGLLYDVGDGTHLQAGDILFPTQPNHDAYKNIFHCAIVLNFNPSRREIRCFSGGQSGDSPMGYESIFLNDGQPMYYARFPIPDASIPLYDICKNGTPSKATVDLNFYGTNITQILKFNYTTSPLDENSIYTLTFDVEGIQEGLYFGVTSDHEGAAGRMLNFSAQNPGQRKISIPFFPGRGYIQKYDNNSPYIPLYVCRQDRSQSYTGEINITNIHLYTGFVYQDVTDIYSISPDTIGEDYKIYGASVVFIHSNDELNTFLTNNRSNLIGSKKYTSYIYVSGASNLNPGSYRVETNSPASGYFTQYLIGLTSPNIYCINTRGDGSGTKWYKYSAEDVTPL